jgi:outer membrane biosynthesis protein TonB
MIKSIMPWLTTDINPYEGWDTMTDKDQQWMSTAGRLGILPHNIEDRFIALGGFPDKILLDEIRTTTINTVITIIDKYAPEKYTTRHKTKKKKKKKKNNDKKNNSPPEHTQPPPLSPPPTPDTTLPTPPQNKKPHQQKNKRKYKPHPAGKDEETDSDCEYLTEQSIPPPDQPPTRRSKRRRKKINYNFPDSDEDTGPIPMELTQTSIPTTPPSSSSSSLSYSLSSTATPKYTPDPPD